MTAIFFFKKKLKKIQHQKTHIKTQNLRKQIIIYFEVRNEKPTRSVN